MSWSWWKTVAVLFVVALLPFLSGCSRPEEASLLDGLVERVTERQSYTEKTKKQFEERLQSYYFEQVPADEIELLLREHAPGVTLAAVAFGVVGKVSPVAVARMKQEGASWPAVAKSFNADLGAVVREVKEFRKAIG